MPRPPNTPKTGGRQKGTPNKRTVQIALAAAEKGITPIEYLLSVMRNHRLAREVRLDAAKAAAPYVHPRLSSVEAKVSHDLQNLDDDDLDRRIGDAAAEAGIAGLVGRESPPDEAA